MRIAFVLASAFAFIVSGQASAEDDCMTPLTLTEPLIDASGAGVRFVAPRGATPALLIGGVSATADPNPLEDGAHGAILFVRDDDEHWRALLAPDGEDVVALYQDANGASALFTMLQTEGPGPSWTLIQSSDGFRTITCTTIAFPKALNEPNWANEYLELLDFDIDARGRGQIIGAANVERDGEEKTLYYSFRTSDFGRTWRAPTRIRGPRRAHGERYDHVEPVPSSAGVEAELYSFAASRN